MLMAAARLDLASVFLYAGSIMPGYVGDKEVTIIDAFEAVGACGRGLIGRDEVTKIEKAICPGEGACGGMYTANTMASAAEAMGMALPGSAAPPAVDRRRDGYARRSGEAGGELIRRGITTRDILTKEALENAVAVVMALAGSTNAVLHLMAIAHEADIPLGLDDFNRIGDRVPHLADVKPFGRYVMTDVDRIGGVSVVMRVPRDAGLLHGDCLTVTGKTMAENLAALAPPDPDGKIIHALSEPIHPRGGITLLRGCLPRPPPSPRPPASRSAVARSPRVVPLSRRPASKARCSRQSPASSTASRPRWMRVKTGRCGQIGRAHV